MTPGNKIDDLQILRGVAVSMVLLSHFLVSTVLLEMLPFSLSSSLFIGVHLFFVISGFVIARSLMRTDYDPVRFAVRRGSRLYPTLVVFLVVSGAVNAAVRVTGWPAWVFANWTTPLADFLEQAAGILGGYLIHRNSTVGYMNATMWVLSVEFHFYAVALLLAIAAASAGLTPRMTGHLFFAAAAGVYAAAVYGRLLLALGQRLGPGSPLVAYGSDFLALGVLLAFLPDRTFARFRRRGGWPVLAAFLIPIMIIALCRGSEIASSRGPNYRDGVGMLAVGLSFASLVALGVAGAVSAALPRPLCRLLAAIGDRSYTIYVLHLPCMVVAWVATFMVNEAWVRSVRTFAIPQVMLALAILVPATELVHRRVERRWIGGGAGVAARWRGSPLARNTVLSFLRPAFIIAIATLALAEIGLRIYHRIHPLSIFYSDSYNRFRGKPFARDLDSRLNSKGFKDVEFETRKADGTFRILGIGDSFAFGVVPYANNYLTLLEEGLNRSGHKVEVINMGIPGIGPSDYLALLLREGLELQPDLVLVSLFIGNDLLIQEGPRTLIGYSYVATAIKYSIDRHTKFEGQIVSADLTYDDGAPTFADEAYLAIEHDRSNIYVKQDKGFAQDFVAALSHILRMKEICDHRGIRFTVVLIPDEVQVDGLLRQKVIRASRLSPEVFDFARPNTLLGEQFAERNIDYVDLLEDFRFASTSARLYKPNDTHWNVKGNEVAADLIAKHLVAGFTTMGQK